MKIFAISDLHLSLSSDKPMDVFGGHWKDHHLKIAQDWTQRVEEEDLVLLPGDHSWALKLEEASQDLAFIAQLPGRKILLKGNHDLWWQSRSQLEAVLAENMLLLQNDAVTVNGVTVAGTRGWLTPLDESFGPDDEKIFKRECLRLEMSLAAADSSIDVCMMHYPPVTRDHHETEFARIMRKYGVKTCIYGHLHGASTQSAFEGLKKGIEYHLVSCDHLGFKLLRLFS